jgi:1-pyrroline-5-carboxylate dehydrogenase
MSHGRYHVPHPINEPVRSYAPGAPERASLKAELERQAKLEVEIPLVIGGQRVKSGDLATIAMPHAHQHVLAKFHQARPEHVEAAAKAARAARDTWGRFPWEERVAVFLRAGELLAGPWRDKINAATMLGQSKTAHQAEIDSACEMIDFLRFNAWFAQRLYDEQPESLPGTWNRMEHRPLDGFVFALTPFNFTSIGGNLPSAPALLGNTVLWKPASTAVLSNYYLLELFEAAGMPPGVINFLPGSGAKVGDPVLAHADLGGVHFTGSTDVFNGVWATVAKNLAYYGRYPRLVGETGGKDFIFAHASAEPQAIAVALVRGAFEYQGQKCSAASRAYIPRSLWPTVRERMVAMLKEMKVGDVRDFTNFMGAVIDQRAWKKLTGAVAAAKANPKCEIVFGGSSSDKDGWFLEPTVILSQDPKSDTMCTELFGPVLTLHVYDDAAYAATLELCNTTSPYALTGAIFADDRAAVQQAFEALRYAAGNFYVNDKPTGAIVGQQPFGGARASGTNDKAGSILNLMRWISPRAIKETFVPPTDWKYPFQREA